MKADADQHPSCGARFGQLGVRPDKDIAVQAGGIVQPRTGGMSVTPDNIGNMPLHLRPKSHGGAGALPVFEIETAALGSCLDVRRDPANPRSHAFVEPAATMRLTDLQQALCMTRTAWKP